MKVISAQEWELLSFIEVEPELESPGDPWPYTDVLYKVQRGNCSLTAL